ncbi:MAG: Crp/Fnr family transcriptional regulator [Sedimenticola sp.]
MNNNRKQNSDLNNPCSNIKCETCKIRKIALFRGVPHGSLSWTEKYRETVKLEKKHHLYHIGDNSKRFYTLYSGIIKLYDTAPNGKSQVLRFCGPGDFIGFQKEHEHGEGIKHGAIALTDCILCSFPRSSFSSLLKEDDTIANELLAKSERELHALRNHITFMGTCSSIKTIAFTLAELDYRLKQIRLLSNHKYSSNNQTLPLTHEDIAQAVGRSSVHVAKQVSKMCDEGLLKQERGGIIVLDSISLRLFADGAD